MIDRDRWSRLSEERWRRRVARKGKQRHAVIPRYQEESFGYKSPILDLFGCSYVAYRKRTPLAPRAFIVPAVFSLSLNVVETLNFIRQIVLYARISRRPRLIIDHRKVSTLGLGAEAYLASILKEISLENAVGSGCYIRGYKSQNAAVRKMMDEIGCVRVLDTGVNEDITVSVKSKAQVFRHQNRGLEIKTDGVSADPIAVTTADFSDHLDKCLSHIGKRLSASGRSRLCTYVAEILINAQKHSGTSQWVIVGYIDAEDERLTYKSAIFSLGNTIPQTFANVDKDSYVWKIVQPYIEIHEKNKLFRSNWRPIDLLSVIALQGHVSSMLEGPDSDRGQGTVDLIEFFQQMSGECGEGGPAPAMNIVTGKTHIRFDGTYKMEYVQERDRMIIAFNSDNDLLKPPDNGAVIAMSDAEFPGVMISISVPLSRSAIEEVALENKDAN